ncbi:MAG: DUF445 domain-containing protein [Propionibacteriaceae bacterium]|nr:DUF445 domain-containing protein [Propionibacteriaceae bacterium]
MTDPTNPPPGGPGPDAHPEPSPAPRRAIIEEPVDVAGDIDAARAVDAAKVPALPTPAPERSTPMRGLPPSPSQDLHTAPPGLSAPPSMLEDSPEDAVRRKGLRQMRIVATSLLVLAAVVFLLTLGQPPKSFLGFVNTAAEAAMVGALADWFAVTALFRHPLGIPIPHTALVKRRKNDLGRSLQQFVTTNFLTEAVVRQRLEQTDVGLRLAEWLGEGRNRHRVMTEVASLARRALGRVSDDDIKTIVEESLLPRLAKEDLAPIAGAFLEGIVDDHAHHGLVDLLLRELDLWVERNPDRLKKLIGERAPVWSPIWVDRMVGKWGYEQIQTWITQIREDPEHDIRVALDDLLADLARDLQEDEQIRERAEALKVRLLTHASLIDTVISLWQSLRSSLLAALEDQDSSLWRRGDGWIAEFATRLGEDAPFRDWLETRFNDIVCYLVQRYGPELAGVISHTVESWDADEASRKIELFVGRDLQFIRINGTIVGALAGLAIHTVAVLVS